MKKLCLLVLLVGAFGSGACGGKTDKAAQTEKPIMTDKSLFERLGGKPAITAVVDDFVNNLTTDPAIKARFTATDVPSFKQKLSDQICAATGGDCKYTGKDMATAHAGMKISDAEFDALVADLKKSLDKLSVPAREQGELLSALGGMRGDIVGK